MKVNDYWRLAKISLKSRKKSTRSTVRGMSISLIIILPLVFAMIGIYASVLPQLNKNPQLLYATFMSGPKGTDMGNDEYYGDSSLTDKNLYEYNCVDRTEVLDKVEDVLHYSMTGKNVSSSSNESEQDKFFERIEMNGNKYPLRLLEDGNGMGYNYVRTSLAVVKTDDIGLLEQSKYGVLGDKYNKGFTGNGKKQVILSRKYLKMANLNEDDVYGKTISIYMRERTNDYRLTFASDSADSLEYVDHYLLRDFEVVGIIGSSTYSQEHQYESNTDINKADIIVSGASYYDNSGKPAIQHSYEITKLNDYDGEIVCNVGNVDEKNQKAKEYVFTGLTSYSAYGVKFEKNNTGKCTGKLLFLDSVCYKYMPYKEKINPYGQVSKVFNQVYAAYRDTYPSAFLFQVFGGFGSEEYNTFVIINFFLTIAMSVLSVFAGIILFAALVNLFNTIMHSVATRKNYLGVMRAIGARSNVIPKLYLFEVLRVFLIAFIWIAVIGGGICIGLKYLFDWLFTSAITIDIGVKISIGWSILPIALGAMLLLLLVVGVCYAVGCSWKLSRKPITEILEG